MMYRKLWKRAAAAIMSAVMIAGMAAGKSGTATVFAQEETPAKTAQVSLGPSHNMVLTEGGALYCWGSNTYGAVGDGSGESQKKPVKILENVASIAAGTDYSAAVTRDGTLYCWGINNYGQLGDGTTENKTKPVAVLENVSEVYTGIYEGSNKSHTAAVTKNGDLYCWGYNGYGQVGNGSKKIQTTPVKVLSNVTDVSLGQSHSAAITGNGDLYCWGCNLNGITGSGSSENEQTTPVYIKSGVKVVSLGKVSSAAITEDGGLYSWGANNRGVAGCGTTSMSKQKTPRKILDNAASASLYSEHSAAVTKNGDLYCWGYNDSGRVGTGDTEDQGSPVRVLSGVTYASVNWSDSIALTERGEVYCWGVNDQGQAGNGTTEKQMIPAKVLEGASAVFQGLDTSAAITVDGELYVWGGGQLSPVKIELPLSSGGNEPSPEPDKEDSLIEFTLDAEASGTSDETIRLNGKLKASDNAEVSGDFFEKEISEIIWSSSNPAVAKVTGCKRTGLSASGSRLATFQASITPGVKGTAVITGKTSNGLTAKCRVTVEESEEEKEDQQFDESLYHASYLYDFYKDKGSDAGMNYHFSSDTPSQITWKAAKEEGLATKALLWDTMKKTLETVDSPSTVLDKGNVFSQKDVYEGIIFSIFQDASERFEISDENIHKDAKKLLGVIKTDMANIYGVMVEDMYDLSDLGQEQKEWIRFLTQDYFKSYDKIMKLSDTLEGAVKCLDAMDDLKEYVEHCANCVALASMSESYKQILTDMYEACPVSDLELKTALRECVRIMNEESKKFIEKVAAGSLILGGEEVVKWAMDKMWEDVKLSVCAACPMAGLYWASYKTGTFVADSVFHTSSIAERTFKLAAMLDVRELVHSAYEKEKSAFASERNRENAENYLASIDVYYNYLDEDCESASSFTETVTDSLAGKLWEKFGASSGEELKKSIKNIQSLYRLEYGSTQMGWLYGLEEVYPQKYKEYQGRFQELKEKYYISCPVDVRVTDASGNIVASVIGGRPYCKEGEPFTVAASGEEKSIWFYGDSGQYTVTYAGTDDGTMDVVIENYERESEYNNSSELARTVKYLDILLKKNTKYTSKTSLSDKSRDYDFREERTSGLIIPTVDTESSSARKYTLTLENGYLAGENGMAFEGEFYEGEKVKVFAGVLKGMLFRGWNADVKGMAISEPDKETAVVTMPARNVKLTARYDKVSKPEDNKEEEENKTQQTSSPEPGASFVKDKVKYKVSASGKEVTVMAVTDKSLKTKVIPDTVVLNGSACQVTAIAKNAFRGCKKLVKVSGCKKVASIGDGAFYQCAKLATVGSRKNAVTLPKVKVIGNKAFYGCKAIRKCNITSAALTKIGSQAFQGCTSLTSVTAKSPKLASIGKKAFYGDKKLGSITFKTSKLKKAKVGASAFKGIRSSCRFKVPRKQKSSYRKIFQSRGAGKRFRVS